MTMAAEYQMNTTRKGTLDVMEGGGGEEVAEEKSLFIKNQFSLAGSFWCHSAVFKERARISTPAPTSPPFHHFIPLS